MTSDPHAACRYANDVTLSRSPQADRLSWPCGLHVDVLGDARKARYFLPELNTLHEEARRVRQTTMRQLSADNRRARRVQRKMTEARTVEPDPNRPPA